MYKRTLNSQGKMAVLKNLVTNYRNKIGAQVKENPQVYGYVHVDGFRE